MVTRSVKPFLTFLNSRSKDVPRFTHSDILTNFIESDSIC